MRLCTANKITQTQGQQYAPWNFLMHLTWDYVTRWDLWASCEIRGYTLKPNRPATLTLQDFLCRLPNGARVKEIHVRSAYNKMLSPDRTKYPEPGTPKVNLVGLPVDLGVQNVAATGTDFYVCDNVFKCDLDASVINSADFGVTFDFPTNRNNIKGYVALRNLYLEIYYEVPDYEITIQKVKGEYRKDTYEISATISNKTDTTHTPQVQITIPEGFKLEQYQCKGNVQQNAQNITWIPKLNRISSDTILMTLSTSIDWGDTASYTGTFRITESYNGTYKNLNVTVQRYYPTTVDVTEFDTKAIQNEEFEYTFSFTDEEMTLIREESSSGYVQFRYLDLNGDIQAVSVIESAWKSNNEYTVTMIGETLGTFPVKVGYYTDTTLEHYFKETDIDVVPNETDSRNIGLAILPVNQEELNRMGSGQVYTAQVWMRLYTNETSVRDWKYNFRLGVFNEGIPENIVNYEYIDENGETKDITVDSTDYDDLTIDDILENTIWSDIPTSPTGWNNLTCSFRYNKEYPLYIIVTGDNKLMGADVKSPRFTEPTISETAYYIGDEPNGVFPMPILNTMDENATTDMIVPALNTTNTLIFYDFNINKEFGEDYIVRGAQLTGDVDGNNIALSAKLINQGNETRIKSTVIDDLELNLGGYGDLWGFKTDQIKDFKDWEIHLTPSNTILTDPILFHMNNIRLSLYVDKLEGAVIKTYINGEDLDYYGAFVTDLKIPEGLKTDTDYLKVNGTDINNPYLQSIKEKEIEIDFDLGDACDIYGNTVALRQLTKLLVNERDKYNKPIPKRLEFSHYPDVYWEYIMEDGFTPELDINTYEVKVKLTIPAGTAFTKKDITTINQGYVDGLTHVNPTILIGPFSSLIQITDEDSQQHFNMGYTDFAGCSMRIECGKRKVYLIEDGSYIEKDITKYVDRNSDWFRLLGYFNFKTTGCLILNVSFKERW